MTSSLTLASQTIGFISFSITLLTLLGVYRDLISTLRSAPIQIPLLLGNLRQEILAERTYLRQRCREGRDPFGVFPARLAGLPGSSRGKVGKVGRKGGVGHESSYVHLLEVTVKDLWLEFRMLERPFLVRGAFRAEAIAKGDYWGEEDVDVEKALGSGDEEVSSGLRRRRRGRGGGSSRRRNRSDREEWEAAEEDLRREGAKYYNTNLAHRFIWWQTKSDIQRLADQVQRIQIRRMERDIFETDELVRILIRGAGLGDIGFAGKPGGRGSGGGGTHIHSDSDSDEDDGGRASAVVLSRAGSRAGSRTRSRRRSSTNYREVEEREVVRRGTPAPRPSPSPPRPRTRPQPDHEANVAARRTERRRSGPRVEYEVLRRGSDGEYVVVNDTRERPPRRRSVYQEDGQEARRRSYSRERGRADR